MKKMILLPLLFISTLLQAQKLTLKVINARTSQPVPGATLKFPSLHIRLTADSNGLVDFHPGKGQYEMECAAVSYQDKEMTLRIPFAKDSFIIALEPFAAELEGVTVSSTRSNRSINNTATRAEIINEEEIHEESEMRPGDIKMLLNESTGIQAQQTSATSGNASLRIQGLDGRYTQILKDGFPIYSGAATGLGILQTPPVDLKQVEIIKGSTSTLYGGGAIAGLINLISKTPSDKPELTFHVNHAFAGGDDLNGFYSKRSRKAGVVLFASRNTSKAYDPAHISFSAIPELERYSLHPKLFFYFSPETMLAFGINATLENRLGGDMNYIDVRGDTSGRYFERNKTNRFSTQLSFDQRLGNNSRISIKNSIAFYNRIIQSPSYLFDGTQLSSFTEAVYTRKHTKSDWVAGLNLLTDHFKEKALTQVPPRNYQQQTLGLFIQHTWNAAEKVILETGLRADHVNGYGTVLLPRIALLFTFSPKLTSRLGGGFGYKAPTIFTEETEKLLYRNVLPVDPNANTLETSYGLNADINYRTNFGPVNCHFNQFFFYTVIRNPLFLVPVNGGLYSLRNRAMHTVTRGAEANLKLSIHELALYLGYTFTETAIPLTPKHRFNSALVYEIEGKWKFGSELYFFSRQTRNDGTASRSYWLAGFLAEKIWKHFSVYANFENLGDVRQTRFENIYTGPAANPVFRDIYAPLDGFVANAGIRCTLLR